MAPQSELESIHHWQVGLLDITKPKSRTAGCNEDALKMCTKCDTGLAIAHSCQAQQMFALEKALEEALVKNLELERQLEMKQDGMDQLEQELLMKDMECAGLQAKCEAIEDMEAEGAASAVQESSVRMQVEQLQKELDARSQKLCQVEQELYDLKTDLTSWRPHWDGKEFVIQDLSKQVVFLQQERCAVFINQQNSLRKGHESTGDAADRMTMTKLQTLEMERLAAKTSVATRNEILILQQLTDIWNLRLEVVVRGMDNVPPEWPVFIPEPSRTKSRWRTMKEELRMQVGLPCQPRASHRQRNRKYKEGSQENEHHSESEQEYEDIDDDECDQIIEEYPASKTDGNAPEQYRQETHHHQEVKQQRELEARLRTKLEARTKPHGDKHIQHKVSGAKLGGGNGMGHYSHRDRMMPHHADPSLFFVCPTPMQQLQQQRLGAHHGQFQAMKQQPHLYPAHHYENWHFAGY